MAATPALAVMMVGSGISAGSQLAAGEYNAKVAGYNAKVANAQAADALVRGEQEVTTARRKGSAVIGAQRAALAAQGVEVNTDTASQLQEDTARATAEDVVTIRNNAKREAWGYKVQATNYKAQARLARYEGVTGAAGTLLGGGAQTYNAGRATGAW